ncbi:unnamed protein product [Leptidea sinapis]|uniref:TLC domain-containing protein n=1 Tax=Leptidea sinapis TaxID=189913 RepID=A0A5E4PRV9_9NEOP|nr:unnamed protein product [Leptidea sinapis]
MACLYYGIRSGFGISITFYWSLTISQFWDVRRKDFWQMFIHHIATIALFSFSWVCNLHRIGTLVLICHDCADIFLELCDLLFAVFTAHVDPSTNAPAHVPGVLHLQLAAVSAAGTTHRVDLAYIATCIQLYQRRKDGR